MKTSHPSEEELQEYALGNLTGDPALVRHISTCETCESKVAAYRFIAAEIKRSPIAGFEFDQAAEELAQIPVKQPLGSSGKQDSLLTAAFLLLLALPFYFYRTQLAGLFSEVSGAIVYPAGALTLIIVIIRALEMDRAYHQKLRQLNNQHHLQH